MQAKLIVHITLILFITSCQVKTSNSNQSTSNEKIENSSSENLEDEDTSPNRDASYYKEKGYQIFSEFGLAIKAPDILEDVSKQSPGDFALNYAVTINGSNPTKTAFYQLMVIRLPVGYKENHDLVEEKLLSMVNVMDSYKKVKVGHSGYDGYIANFKHNEYAGKVETFHKDEYIFGLTVITNDNLRERFNQFTNSLRFFDETKSNEEVNMSNSTETNKVELSNIGLTITNPPCLLTQGKQEGHDYYYHGAINGDDRDNAIVYKIMVNELPMNYSEMIKSDKETIKSNLLSWAESKGVVQKINNTNCHYSLTFDYMEQGFKIKQAIILTDKYVYEFMVLSKLNIDKEFRVFLENMRYLN